MNSKFKEPVTLEMTDENGVTKASSRRKLQNTGESKYEVLPLLPLRDVVVFPYMVIPLFVGRQKSIAAVEAAMKGNHRIFVGAQRDAKNDEPGAKDIYRTGVICELLQLLKLPDGNIKILIEGIERGLIKRYVRDRELTRECPFVEVESAAESAADTIEIRAQMRNSIMLFEQYIKMNQKIPVEIMMVINNTEEPSRLSDIIIAHFLIPTQEKQKILEILDVEKRLARLSTILDREIKIMNLERKIRGKVKDRIEKYQKEYYLREQLKAIREELGHEDDISAEAEEYRQKIEAADLPKSVREKVEKELSKFERMMPGSAEGTVVRNYLDWIFELPWNIYTDDDHDLDACMKVLEEDHHGLMDIKDRIMEHLAVTQLNEKERGQILCFVGPPGVGKTSLGKSIARALGRNFARMSLGGVRDEAEIRGHRRTYIGALPGKIVQLLKRAKSCNPVLLLDEVDKMSTDFRGDPSAALLEVLDPEQNCEFEDHYLSIPYDLSNVMFILTANIMHPIPPALRDRMEIIEIPGYTEIEKLNIARRFLVPRQLEKTGLGAARIEFHDEVIMELIRYYTRESGVRTLEKFIASVCRKLARRLLSEAQRKKKDLTKLPKMSVSVADINDLIGPRKFLMTELSGVKAEIGLVTGLAWTAAGGEVLPVEVVAMEGKGKMILTGKLGDVMKESAQAGYSYIRAHSRDFGLKSRFFEKRDLHIHIPEGAIPKDGPSAGITMATAIVSELTRRPVDQELAMTGEITLRGKVLPVGGIKEKVLAAHRAGLRKVILPRENEKDARDIPEEVRNEMVLVFVKSVSEVFELALGPAPAKKSEGGATAVIPAEEVKPQRKTRGRLSASKPSGRTGTGRTGSGRFADEKSVAEIEGNGKGVPGED